MLPTYSVEIEGETVFFLALNPIPNTEDVIEMDFVRECVALRQLDEEAYELVWDFVLALRERGPVMDRMEG